MLFWIYCAISAACLEIAFVSLVTKKMALWQYSVLFVQLFVSCWLMEMHIGQFAGGVVFAISVILVLGFIREFVLWNIFLICFGYLVNVLLNNLFLFAGIKFFNWDLTGMTMVQKILLSLAHAFISYIAMYRLRYCLYEKINLRKYFWIPRVIKLGVTLEMLLFVGVFIINVANGDKIGYSREVISFNFLIFAICMLINIVLLIICGYMVKKDTERKYLESKNQMLNDYVNEVDSIITEWRLFQHDYKNIMYTATGFLIENKYEELKIFWNKEMNAFGSTTDSQRRWASLSNIMPIEIKGIFFEKISRGLSEDIQIHIEVMEKVEIQGMNLLDLSRILGIYLDNALEAAKETPVSVLWIIIEKTQNGFHLRIENTMNGKVDLSRIGNKGYSTKGDAQRGLGLYSAGKILEKYGNVYTNTQCEEGKFIQELDIVVE